MIHYQDDSLIIRSMAQSDINKLVDGFAEQNWHKPVELFELYFNQQEQGKQKVIVAEVNKEVAGYVTLFPFAKFGPFAADNIPEIVDLNVLINYQKMGIGNRMMDVIENIAAQMKDSVSLAVGLHNGYGTAQKMYVKRGFIPDGSGVWYKGKQLEQYAPCVNDDDLLLYFSKRF